MCRQRDNSDATLYAAIAALNCEDSLERVRTLLVNFRLLEAAGACSEADVLRRLDSDTGTESRLWLTQLAQVVRSYRGAIFASMDHGYSAIERWADALAQPPSTFHLEAQRLAKEYRYWLVDVPAGSSYIAWLAAYIATAELDGEQAMKCLHRALAAPAEFVDVPAMGDSASGYDLLQSTADCIGRFLSLQEHPVTDMRRFVLLPTLGGARDFGL